MTTGLTNNKGYQWFDLKETVRESAWALSRTVGSTVEKNYRFAAAVNAYDPSVEIVVYPFADDCVGFATLVTHPELGDVVVADLPWHPIGTAA